MKAKKYCARKESGFTLLEILVVITVIGIVIATLIGIFGNPLADATTRNAASQVSNHLRSISDGANYFFVRTTTRATTMAQLTTGAAATLTSPPVPPPHARSTAHTGTYAYALNTTTYTQWRTTAPDTVVVLEGLTDESCRTFNEMYAGSATIFTAVQANRNIQCIRPAGAAFATALMVAYAN
jgi:prepilin-type N-terminal cleavage/methylation domain-containing protein